jgi:hypothetical protein
MASQDDAAAAVLSVGARGQLGYQQRRRQLQDHKVLMAYVIILFLARLFVSVM